MFPQIRSRIWLEEGQNPQLAFSGEGRQKFPQDSGDNKENSVEWNHKIFSFFLFASTQNNFSDSTRSRQIPDRTNQWQELWSSQSRHSKLFAVSRNCLFPIVQFCLHCGDRFCLFFFELLELCGFDLTLGDKSPRVIRLRITARAIAAKYITCSLIHLLSLHVKGLYYQFYVTRLWDISVI